MTTLSPEEKGTGAVSSGAPALPTGTGPLSPQFTGINPALMDGFVAEIDHARGVIGERTEAIRRVFAANGVPATSLNPIAEIEHWLDERLPDLRRRSRQAHELAKLPSWAPGGAGALLPYEEKTVLPAAEARRLGTDLASQYKSINPDAFFDPGLDEKYQKIVNALAAHSHDPEFTTAFFTSLGLNRTMQLPERLRRVLQEGDQEAVDTVSRALGTAISAGAAGMAAISKGLKDKADKYDDQKAIGELLSAGRFPTEWLAQVVATQIFTPGDKATGSVLTPYLHALANDPGAARLAISLATSDSPLPRDALAKLSAGGLFPVALADRRPNLVAFLKNLNDRAAVDATSADAFGRVLAAASGAYDEKDGHHSDMAARFAFTVITTADGLKLADPTRIHLSEIAGAYATEITEGANLSDVNHLLSSAYGNFKSQIPGLKPAFRLSPEDTYKFIRTFTDTTENQMPFREGMGNLARRLIDAEVPTMMKSKDTTQLDDLFAALGNVSGLQLAAEKKWGKAKDDAADASDKTFSTISGNTLGVFGLFVPGAQVGATLWTVLSGVWSAADTYKPDQEKEVEKIENTDNLETLGRQHAIAQALMDAGFKPKISPQDYQAAHPKAVAISETNGHLRPFADILKTGKGGIESLDSWFLDNGADDDKNSLGGVTRFLADRFDGRKDYSRDRARMFD
ncbi:DUF6571 family protein [Sphaerisporangium fuscum]|uniref:DUF6571 family protein n=1 Tax=Sphaerisporangium fuscum TaxID=2835868 RepID=UPI001BDD6E37|nr:DUF6571 family protein [Sphaerisporangium fuscum]